MYPTSSCLRRTSHAKSRTLRRLLTYKEVFFSCNFIHISLLGAILSLFKKFSPWIILWQGRDLCGVTQMRILPLNSTSWKRRVIGHSTYSRGVYIKSLNHIKRHHQLNFSTEIVQNCCLMQLFSPFLVLWVIPYLLTHAAEHFCTHNAPKNLSDEIIDWYEVSLIAKMRCFDHTDTYQTSISCSNKLLTFFCADLTTKLQKNHSHLYTYIEFLFSERYKSKAFFPESPFAVTAL